jgi:hypothetical protein
MVRALALVAILVTGCFDETYHCTSDEQCDVGEGGRCEIDGFCTHFDGTANCPTQRRYSDHADALTNTCFDDRVTPINPCAGGQPPALPVDCYADVCARLPACCTVAWTDACVQIAQEACTSFACDTRLAVNAANATQVDRFEVDWDGAAWTITPRTGLGAPLMWVGPRPGDGAPRLAYATADALVIDTVELPIEPDHTYNSIASIDFDRDGRDTIAASFQTPTTSGIEIWKVDTLGVRETGGSSHHLTWGDDNRDGFPDALTTNSSSAYVFFNNIDGDSHVRTLSSQAVANVSGGATPGAPQIGSLDWLDFNGDTAMDLAAFGNSIRLHTRAADLNDQSQYELDCDPPDTDRSCNSDPEPDLEQTAFVGAALPTAAAPSVVVGTFPERHLYRIALQGTAVVATRMTFPGDTCTCTKMCSGGNCTYDCGGCPTILALAARDLDGDHALDLIAIDAKLRLYTATAASGFTFGAPTPLIVMLPANYTSIELSISGDVSP